MITNIKKYQAATYHALNLPENKCTYNGKTCPDTSGELEDEFGLGWYHYGARYYDPQVSRWHSTDPADEFLSAYVYVGNDPIMLVDPDGRMSSCPPDILCTFNTFIELFTASNFFIEFDAAFSGGAQVATEFKALGAKGGFDLNQTSFDILSIQSEFRNNDFKLSATGLTSKTRLQRQSFGFGLGAGVSKSRSIKVKSRGGGSLDKIRHVDFTKQIDAILFTFGTEPINQQGEKKLFIGEKFGFKAAFGIGFEASLLFGFEIADETASKIMLDNR